METHPEGTEVLDFWRDAGPKKWFAKNAEFDAEFKARFETAHLAAATGTLDHWASYPEGALALLVLLDQFPRNAWRGSGHMFATDGKARAVAGAAIDAGLDQHFDAALRAFFYLPFMHSESLADQERSVRLNAALDDDTQRHARMHRDLIARFGRFPHRNAALGRLSTPTEQRYLEAGGFGG
jgi:uncharacterized protein (DUF924 family)